MTQDTEHDAFAPLVACTVSRDVQLFDLLIEDMEAALGAAWGDLSFAEAAVFLDQPDAAQLRFIVLAIDAEDEATIAALAQLVHKAKARGLQVILVADDVTPVSLHQLLREGADEFVPYPLPEGELAAAIARLDAAATAAAAMPSAAAAEAAPQAAPAPKAQDNHSGVVIPVQSLAGGAGGTTLAVNLAYELAHVDKKDPPRVCLLDFSFQFGAVGTYLDIPRRETVLEFLTHPESFDSDTLLQVLQPYGERLHVLTSPADVVPLDLVAPADLEKLIECARRNFDYVIIDMPGTMVDWSESVLNAAHIYFAVIERDMRSAENTRRLKAMLTGEGLAFSKLRFILNRAPGLTDFSGKTRVKSLTEKLGISLDVQLPDGGRQVCDTADDGKALGDGAPKNVLRREIAKLAKSLHAVNVGEPAPAAKGKKFKR